MNKTLQNALRIIPSVGILATLWAMVLRQLFHNWDIIQGLSTPECESLTVTVAAPLALVTFFLGNVWDDRVFRPLYGDDPESNFKGKWLDTSRRNLLGLFPAGHDLRDQRAKAQEAMQLPTV